MYSGCGDGTHIWNPEGTLIGKFFFNSTTARMIFTKSGLLILSEERIYLANIQAQGIDLCSILIGRYVSIYTEWCLILLEEDGRTDAYSRAYM